MREKLLYLGFMINKLIKIFIGVLEPDDRDYFINKRVKLVGDLLFEQIITQFKEWYIIVKDYLKEEIKFW